MKFQIISDLYLKEGEKWTFPILSENLILAGNISNPYEGVFWDFLKFVSRSFKKVIFIPGNYEFQQYSINIVEKFLMETFRIFPNIYYLNNNWLIIDNIAIFGSILLSKISKNIKHCIDVSEKINDLTIKGRNLYFKACCNTLKTGINFHHSMDKKIIVVTHYSPIVNDSEYNGTNLHFFMDIKKVDYFIHGHTNHNYPENILNTEYGTYISNQRGKNDVEFLDNFNPNFILEI